MPFTSSSSSSSSSYLSIYLSIHASVLQSINHRCRHHHLHIPSLGTTSYPSSNIHLTLPEALKDKSSDVELGVSCAESCREVDHSRQEAGESKANEEVEGGGGKGRGREGEGRRIGRVEEGEEGRRSRTPNRQSCRSSSRTALYQHLSENFSAPRALRACAHLSAHTDSS
eukprot:768644-Hanusia_phi.AAC.4